MQPAQRKTTAEAQEAMEEARTPTTKYERFDKNKKVVGGTIPPYGGNVNRQ